MEGYKVVGIKKNGYLKNDKEVKNLTVYLENESPDVVGYATSSFYISDARNLALYVKCETLNCGDIVVPVKNTNGQYETLENVVIIARAK